ncbi:MULTISPECIES: helix-turn-helix domain-containing protein [unclassified Haladaptatus]|uniref:helix-turn-helix domain-containing protein n=1 Tax=unclassified Haladaptatus TaxID=2622732 RepID=UPI00209BE0CE|nr:MULTISPECIES: helix-turn-helix domain-containing protein [unclassified Haladaptatus]MCO8244207.1 helix-turn-helix domain-containing protein [Haladaptatus sp. AB643]MCO8256011.1 helix-turn-helix domain-containing protein [Haladaptatus sp. AB618]
MIDECLVVEFAVTGDDCPLAEASRKAETRIDCKPPQHRDDGYTLLRFSAPAENDALVDVLDGDDRIRYLHVTTTDGRRNFRCLSKHACVVHELTNVGFMAESLRYREGNAKFTGAVVGHDVLQGVLEAAGETVGMRLERVHQLGSQDENAVAQQWDVTPAQERALRTALEFGYFSVPRETTASDVAGELGISKSAFLERLRRAERSMFSQMFA